jgi:hypothetical protein
MIPRTVSVLFLFLAILFLQVGCKKDDKPSGDQGTQSTDKTQGLKGPPVEVSAEKLAEEYAADRKAADAKYKNKLLQVKGTVATVNKFETSNRIYLAGYKKKPTDSLLDYPVRCAVRPELLDKVPLLSRGQLVQVTGKCTDGGTGVNLADCGFKELGESSVIQISAEDLTKEFAANKDAADKKYNNKEMIVEGPVADLALQQLPPRAILAGDAPWTVACKTGQREEFQKLTKGEKARIRGHYDGYLNNQVLLNGSFVLKAK